MWLARDDGLDQDIQAEIADPTALAAHLNGLSTFARFKRFARDFRAAELGPGVATPYHEEVINGETYVVLTLAAAAEFMSKKDYTDNWTSEMHEAFAFWDFSEWKTALQTAGFNILENANDPAGGSRVYTNPWIVRNRWQGKVTLSVKVNGTLEPLPLPPTNIVLVGERPALPRLQSPAVTSTGLQAHSG